MANNTIPLDETNAVVDVIALRSLLDYLTDLVNKTPLCADTKDTDSTATANSLGAVIPIARNLAKQVEAAILKAV